MTNRIELEDQISQLLSDMENLKEELDNLKEELAEIHSINMGNVDYLIKALLDNKYRGVREAAITALDEINDPQFLDIPITALDIDDWKVREAAAIALGRIKDPRSLEPLITALNDKHSGVREAAAKALDKIRG